MNGRRHATIPRQRAPGACWFAADGVRRGAMYVRRRATSRRRLAQGVRSPATIRRRLAQGVRYRAIDAWCCTAIRVGGQR